MKKYLLIFILFSVSGCTSSKNTGNIYTDRYKVHRTQETMHPRPSIDIKKCPDIHCRKYEEQKSRRNLEIQKETDVNRIKYSH